MKRKTIRRNISARQFRKLFDNRLGLHTTNSRPLFGKPAGFWLIEQVNGTRRRDGRWLVETVVAGRLDKHNHEYQGRQFQVYPRSKLAKQLAYSGKHRR